METLIAFLVAAGITFFFVRGYLRKLTTHKTAVAQAAPSRQVPCPRCGKSISAEGTFCRHCGAAQAIWTVHRADEVAPSADGKPQAKPKPVINAGVCMGCGSCVAACPETGALQVVNGKSMLVDPARCVGHGTCAKACPTGALTLAIGGALQTMRVPKVKENFESNLDGVYIVGELAGMGMIKRAINEGKLAVDHLKQRLDAEKPQADAGGSDQLFDLAIVGAGPAGLSATLTAHQYGLRYLTLEQAEIASTIRQYPRQKFVMAEPIEIPLYGSLYVADGSKEALLAVWETIVANTGIRVQTNEPVQKVQRNETCFHVETSKGSYRVRYVVLALGRRGAPRRLGCPGEDQAKVAYSLIEATQYQDKNIIVVGGGDSAGEAALALSQTGNRVILCHRSATFDRMRERNRDRLQAAETAGTLEVLRNSKIVEIAADTVKLDFAGTPRQVSNDFVFVMAGGQSSEDFLRKVGVEIVERVVSSPPPSAHAAHA